MAVNSGVNEMLLDEVFGLFTAAEQLMLQKITTKIKKGVATSGWNERKLDDLQELRMELEGALAKIHSTTIPGVAKGIVSAHLAGGNQVNTDLKLPKTAMKASGVPWHIQRLILEANGIMKGASMQILRKAEDIYKAVVTDSTSMMLTGVETRLDAAQRALNTFAAKGITGFVDKAGRNWEMASYVEMAIRTVSSRAALQGHIDRSSELDHDLMMVSSFGKTCPICAPWEGVPLSISGKTPGYASLAAAKASGLFHPNCKHTLMAYFPGITETNFRAPYDPEGYNNIQRQRHNERQIRKYKRLEAVAMTPKAQSQSRAKVVAWQKIQRDHCERTGLRRKYVREGIKNRAGNPAAAHFGKHTIAFDNDQQIVLGAQAAIQAAAPNTILPAPIPKQRKPRAVKPKPAPPQVPTPTPIPTIAPAQPLPIPKDRNGKPVPLSVLKQMASRRGQTIEQVKADIIQKFPAQNQQAPVIPPTPPLVNLGTPQAVAAQPFDPDKYDLLGWSETDTLMQYADDFWNKLSMAENNATAAYVQTSNSFYMNSMLYKGGYAQAKASKAFFDNMRTSEKRIIGEIDAFSEVVQKGTIPMDMRVIRMTDEAFVQTLGTDLGMSNDLDRAIDRMNQGRFDAQTATMLREKLSGIQYENKSFISTSYDPDANVFKGKPVMMEFAVDKGTKGLVTQNMDESEIVFDKGTKIEIVDVQHWKPVKGESKIKIICRILQ